MRPGRYLLAVRRYALIGAGLLILPAVACPRAEARVTPMDRVLAEATRYADYWWSRQGTPPPCAYQARNVRVYRLRRGAAAQTPGWGSCVVYWDRGFMYLARVSLLGRLWEQRFALRVICALAIHERGHNIGYGHARHGVMAHHVEVPGGCVSWAARMRPRH